MDFNGFYESGWIWIKLNAISKPLVSRTPGIQDPWYLYGVWHLLFCIEALRSWELILVFPPLRAGYWGRNLHMYYVVWTLAFTFFSACAACVHHMRSWFEYSLALVQQQHTTKTTLFTSHLFVVRPRLLRNPPLRIGLHWFLGVIPTRVCICQRVYMSGVLHWPKSGICTHTHTDTQTHRHARTHTHGHIHA